MFGTFRYNNTRKEPEYVELSRESGVDARGYTLLACALCRARKLKCSGERGGCSRCLASSTECVYGPEGDGHANVGRAGRSKGATRRRRRQTVPPKSSTTDDDKLSTMAPNGRETVDVNGPSRRSSGAQGDGMRADIKDSSPAHPDLAKTASALIGHPSNATPSTDWSNEFFGFDDFTEFGGESTSFGLSSMNSPVDGTVSNSGSSTTPGPVPSFSQPQGPNTSARAPFTPSPAALSVPEALSPLNSQDSEMCFPRIGLTRPGGGCQCLTTLAGILERLGRYRLGDKPKTDKNLDCLLFCLDTGVDACKKALLCKDCNACQEHSILLATIAERLPRICNDLCGCLLIHQHQVRTAANKGALSESPALSSASGDPSGGDAQRESEGEVTLVNGEISFGRYRIQAAEIRLRLIQNLMQLYVTDSLAVLDRMFQRIGQVDGTAGILNEAREMATMAQWMLQQLRSRS